MKSSAPCEPGSHSDLRCKLGAAFIAVVTLVTYAPTLRFPFVLDDWLLIVGSPRVQSWRYVPGYFTSHLWAGMPSVPADYYRPLFLLWLRTNHALFGLNPLGWHITTVLVYVGAAIMVYYLSLRLSQHLWIAVFASLIFALHPSHVETGAWICDSLDPLAAIMFIGAFLCWLRHRERNSASPLIASLLLYAGSMLTKEPAIVLPVVMVAYTWLWDEDGRRLGARAWSALRPVLPFIPIAGLYLIVRVVALRGFSHPAEHLSIAKILLTLPSVILFYVKILAWPIGLSAFYDLPYVAGPDFAHFVLPVIAILSAGAIGWYVVRQLPDPRVARFGAAWFAITLLPALHLPAFSAGELVHDRYIYLSSAGFFLFVAAALVQVKIAGHVLVERRAPRAILLCILTAALMLASMRQQTYWSSDLRLYARGVQIAPNNGLPAMNLGVEFIKRGEYDNAFLLLSDLVRRLPANPAVNYNLGLVHFRRHDFEKAETYLARAAIYDPTLPQAHAMLGLVRVRMGKSELGLADLRRSIELVPDAKGLHGALSEALEAQHDFAGALREAEIEARYSPENAALRDRIAVLKRKTPAPN